MTPIDGLERQLSTGLTDLAGTSTPDYRDDILRQVARTRQRPTWTFPERWTPMALATNRRATAMPARTLVLILLMALLVGLATAGAAIIGSHPLGLSGPDGIEVRSALAMPPTNCPNGPLKVGEIATIAGTGAHGTSGDGAAALSATLSAPYGIAVGPTGAIYVGNSAGYYKTGMSHGVRRIAPDGVITTAAFGPTSNTSFPSPTGVAFDALGNLHVADFNTARIWRIDPTGTAVAVAGTGVDGSDGDGGPALKALISASNMAFGPTGEMYFDDWTMGWHKVDATGIVRPFAGDGTAGYFGDGGLATLALVNGGGDPVALAVDRAGDVYLPDAGNFRIRKVDPAGIITTFAGNGRYGDSGDGGQAVKAAIGQSHGIAVDEAGNVYFSADSGTVRKIDTRGVITAVVGTGQVGFSGDCGSALDAQLTRPNGVAVHEDILYIVDAGNDRIRAVVL